MKVAYIHGRPCSHPMQQKMARAIGAEFFPVDFKLRWQDKPDSPAIRRYLSWIVCSLLFPNAQDYGVFIAAGAHVTPPLMRLFGRINPKQRIIVHLGDELLYSLYSGRFSRPKTYFLKKLIAKYDAIICEGQMGQNIIAALLGKAAPRTYAIINGIEDKHLEQVKHLQPTLDNKNILFIGQGPGELRFWYKGIDLLLRSFGRAYEEDDEISLTVVGDWDEDLTNSITRELDDNAREAIQFVGYTDDLSLYLNRCSLYLHPARGEAFGITVLIALAAGLPTVVSEWTGAKEVVEQISKELIVPLDEDSIAAKISWYFSLTDEERTHLSNDSKRIGLTYTEDRAVSEYRHTFDRMLEDLHLA